MRFFLDEFQKTDFGQEVLYKIKDKYNASEVLEKSGTNMLRLHVNDYFRSATFPDGQITLDVRDEESLAFINQKTGKAMLFPLERILVHELVHASDPRVKIHHDNQEHCHSVIVEEYATQQTDKYAQLHTSHFGIRGAYGNIANAEEQDKILDIKQTGNPIALIQTDINLQSKMQDAVDGIDSQVAACASTNLVKNHKRNSDRVQHDVYRR